MVSNIDSEMANEWGERFENAKTDSVWAKYLDYVSTDERFTLRFLRKEGTFEWLDEGRNGRIPI